MTATGEDLKNRAQAFRLKLAETRASLDVPFSWYLYDIISNIWHIDPMLADGLDRLFEPGKRIADIGAADGDFAFFLESLGNHCDIYDNPPTNMNNLKGAAALKAALESNVGIFSCDLDSQFEISGRYDFVLFLGILYHLKNPFYALEKLASVASHMIVSTRIARRFSEGSADISGVAVAYLVSPDELNGDATNYWILSEEGLRRLVNRAGWGHLGVEDGW